MLVSAIWPVGALGLSSAYSFEVLQRMLAIAYCIGALTAGCSVVATMDNFSDAILLRAIDGEDFVICGSGWACPLLPLAYQRFLAPRLKTDYCL